MGLSAKQAIGEMVLFFIIEYGVFVGLLVVEGVDFLHSIVVVIAAIVYGIAVSMVSGLDVRHGVDEALASSHRRRIGTGVLFFLAITVATWFVPNRALQLLAVFMTLDVLISLLPGRVLLYGRGLWEWNKIAFVLSAILGIAFLVINLAGVPLEGVAYAIATVAAVVMVIGVIVVIIMGLLGLTGKRAGTLKSS